MQEETGHQRLEALFLTRLPTKWVWKKGKEIHKTFKRGCLCSYSHNTKRYIPSPSDYFNSWHHRHTLSTVCVYSQQTLL